MKDLYLTELSSLLKKDITDLKKNYKEQERVAEIALNEAQKAFKQVSEHHEDLNNKLNNHSSMTKVEIKKDKKAWKATKKELKQLVKSSELEYKEKLNILSDAKAEYETIEQRLEHDINELEIHVKDMYTANKERDYEIISGMDITCLATKIKIVIKEYKQVEVPKNPRVGISLGTNFKPRVYMSTNAKKRYKKVMTRNDQYDIRKKDNPETRIIELCEILDIQNPYNLYEHIVTTAKASVGGQYLKEFG